jgi:5-amino-6-(5-phosphoribosylamino)uracil reductase
LRRVEFNRLHPRCEQVALPGLIDELRFADGAPPDRPYVAVNFVASADGRATFAGRSGPLGDRGDREMFHGLRESVDAIMAGTGTLDTERYGRMVKAPERRERRAARGLTPDAPAVVVTRSGRLPLDIPLFAAPEQRVLVFTAAPLSVDGVQADVTVTRMDPAELTGTAVLRRLHHEHGIRSLLCEGGPTLFSSLLHERLVDELFLTVAAKLAGGGPAPAITTGAELPDPLEMDLVWALEREGSLFLRYSARS